MEQLRRRSKHRWKEYLGKFTNTLTFKQFWKSKDVLSEYKIATMEPHHVNEILSILCYCFSCLGGPNNHKILMTTAIDSYERFECEIRHALKTGFNIVLLDKEKHVIALWYGFDYCDQPSYDHTSITDKVKKIKEMHQYALNHCEYIQNKFGNDIQQNAQYGDIFYSYIAAVKPDLKRSIGFAKPLFTRIIVGMMGYKFCLADAVHPITIRRGYKDSKWLACAVFKEYDYRHFRFSDGTNMNEIIKELSLKYKFTDQYVELMRNNCKQAIVGFDFDKVNAVDVRNWIDLWNQWVSLYKTNFAPKL